MDLINHIPGVGPSGSVNPGATTPAPYNSPQVGAVDGVGPGTATKNMAELYNRDLLWRRALIADAGLAFDPTNWVQEVAAIQALIAAASSAYVSAAGTADVITGDFVPEITSLVSPFTVYVRAAAANLTTTPSFKANATDAQTIVRGINQPLAAGDIAGSGYWMELLNDPVLGKWVLQNPATDSAKPGVMMKWPTPVCPAWALVRDGAAVSRTTYANLFNVLCPTRSMTTANGTKNLTGLSTTTDLYVGMPIEGAGVAAGAVIEMITGAATATMSINATASATVAVRLFYYGYGTAGSAATFGVPDDRGLFSRGLDAARSYEQTTLTGTTTNAANTLTGLTTTKGMYVGMPLSAVAGIPGGTTVASITSASAITMSANASATGARAVVFTGGQIGNERTDQMQGHWHEMAYYTNGVVGGSGYLPDTAPTGGLSNTTVRNPVVDQSGSGTPRFGPETRPKFRDYLPIITF